MKKLRIKPAVYIGHGLLFLLAVILSRLPLLGDFHYEYALIFSAALFFVAGYRTFRLLNTCNFTLSGILLSNALLCVSPIALMLLTALFTFESAYLDGLPFLLVYMLPAPVLGTAVAWGIGAGFGRLRRTIFTLFVFVLALVPLIDIYLYPVVFSYNALFTFFPGTIYDENIVFTSKLLYYRLGNLVYFCSLFILPLQGSLQVLRGRPILHMWLDKKKNKSLFLLVWAVIGIALYSLAPAAGIGTSKATLAGVLSVKVETEHFIIHFHSGMKDSVQNAQIAKLHEMNYAELREQFSENPGRINSYIFRDEIQKHQLTGAGRADLAKIHQRSIFMNEDDVYQVVKHELAHVFTYHFAYSPFKVSYMFNPLLLEGTASASSKCTGEYSTKYLASIILAKDTTVSLLTDLAGINFFSASSKSYVLASDFITFVKQQVGDERFKSIYKHGFNSSGGYSIDTLITDYKIAMKNSHSLQSDSEQVDLLYNYYFGKAPLFERKFPHTVAALTYRFEEVMEQKDYAEAHKILMKIEKYTNDLVVTNLRVRILSAEKNYQQCILLLKNKLTDLSSARYRLSLEKKLADLYLHTGQLEEAVNLYTNPMFGKLHNRLSAQAALGKEMVKYLQKLQIPFPETQKERIKMYESMLLDSASIYSLWAYTSTAQRGTLSIPLIHSVLNKIEVTHTSPVPAGVIRDIAELMHRYGLKEEMKRVLLFGRKNVINEQLPCITEFDFEAP